MDEMDFTFSDTIAGYVIDFDRDSRTFGLKTTDGRQFRVQLTSMTYAEVLRNLGEPYQVPGKAIEELLVPGRYLFAHGIYYPEGGATKFESKHIVAVGQGPTEYRFEEADWWVNQVRSLADFYLKAQFPEGVVDYRNYRTHLTVEGQKVDSTRQETDTISRMIYGFATAYLLTGDDRYLECAEKGTEYLRDHLRAVQEQEGVVYWYHAIDVRAGRERKVLASQFGDDFDAIPAYEQIYALAGPVQTYRVTGDPRILSDAEMTLNLFDRFFLDREKGGYFSHVDPIDFDPRSPSLGADRARKNWNSVGDHAPAYLINLWLATGEDRHADFLATLANTIVEHFPDYDSSPYVQERFHEDWSADREWGWQQNRAVVGHNLKIAWNLMRIHHVRPNDRYTALARKIAEIMPATGMDRQRGGWYDVIERVRGEGEEFNRLVWHDRKAWWQQEQAILAYWILAGSLGGDEYVRLARESSAFYNAWFPDHDSGGVYFNVLANGLPYLLGTERLKGSHSMSGYHSFELCYLAAVYTNLLVRKQPMDLYFKPRAGGFKDNVLRVQPDILPPGSVRLQAVWINDERWTDFDPDAMTIKLPELESDDGTPRGQRPAWAGNPRLQSGPTDELKVRVRLAPAGLTYGMLLNVDDGVAELVLDGAIEEDAEELLKTYLTRVVAAQPKQLVLRMEDIQSLSRTSARALAFACEDINLDADIYVVGASEGVQATLRGIGFLEEVTLVADRSQVKVPAAASGS
jgi:mannose/cellobiose epimerase-like protein (N-acyl-D-glucosamine 2-epimerase family)/anti-anti-sigma regulatory factor